MFRELNHLILKTAPKHSAKESAPSSFAELMASGRSELAVWSGESDSTIWDDRRVNWAFRALHDALHVETRLGFTPLEEMALGKLQASRYSGLLADIVYIETAGQAEHYLRHGVYVADQKLFTLDRLKALGYKL